MEPTRRSFLAMVAPALRVRPAAARCPDCGGPGGDGTVQEILLEHFGSKTSEWAAYCGLCKRSRALAKLT